MQPPDERPHVAVYREEFLPRSETFIRDHLLGLTRYRPTAVTGRVLPDALPVPGTDIIRARPQHRLGRMQHAVARRWGREAHLLRSSALVSTMRALRPDVVHAHFGVDGSIVRRAAVRTATPLVVTFHGYDATIRPDVLRAAGGPSAHLVDTWSQLMADAAAIVTVSFPLRNALVARGADPAKTHVVPCGVTTAALAYTPPVQRGPLVFVGRLVEKKGCRDLLEAVAGIIDPPPLVIVGDGPLGEDLKARAQQLRLDVTFLGTADTPQVVAAIRSARFVVMPSKTASSGDMEGLPVVSLEASALGRPVVAYRHSGLVESVIDGVTGDLVDEGDITGLRMAIQALLGDDARLARYSRAARSHVEEHFELRDCLARLEDIYDSVSVGTVARPPWGPDDADSSRGTQRRGVRHSTR